MIIVFKKDAAKTDIEHVQKKLEQFGFKTSMSETNGRNILGAIGDESILREKPLFAMPGVEKVVPISKPYKLVSSDFKKTETVIDIKGVKIGGGNVVVMAGPCSVENRDMLMYLAERTSKAGARILRGGAFKPRTSPYAFQG
ncbi:MAG: 3-deoxy-7-phosphoheptulonate synthase, partial [Seleniivibrio sp.]|nr:3-deoxy-7-phosphoheptulonate synthase [Seleniivibrio sp.]